MKTFYLLIAFITINITAQSYQEGFNAGYSSGYCYQKYGCLSPLPPLAPLQQIVVGQSDYQTGYNTGFAEGQRSQSNPQVQNYGGAYGQLKRVEPDRTQEYIQNAVDRLMQEQKERQNTQQSFERINSSNRLNKKNNKTELTNAFYTENSLINQWIISGSILNQPKSRPVNFYVSPTQQ